MSAVSKKVTPPSIATSTIRRHSSSAGFPHRPNIIVPSPSVLTSIPLAPGAGVPFASGHAGLALEHKAVPVVDAVGDAAIAHQEAHHPAHLDRTVVSRRS